MQAVFQGLVKDIMVCYKSYKIASKRLNQNLYTD
jgi:hypothetical protein